MLRGGRAQREGACLGTGFCKQSSRNAASRARSADHGISHDHNSVSRMVAAMTLQIDALHAHMSNQRQSKSLCAACTIRPMACKLPVNVRRQVSI